MGERMLLFPQGRNKVGDDLTSGQTVTLWFKALALGLSLDSFTFATSYC